MNSKTLNYTKGIVAATALGASLFFAGSAFADSCSHAYGSDCPSGNLQIDKRVRHPRTGEFLDSISSSDATFLPDQEVKFRVEVKNVGGQDLFNVDASDTLPDFVDFISGTGNFDANTKTLSWTIDKIAPQESKFFEVRVKVKSAASLPDLSINCVTNAVNAHKDNMNVSDTASFCIQTKILGTTTVLPKTGVNYTEIALLGSILSAGLAIVAVKKSVS